MDQSLVCMKLLYGCFYLPAWLNGLAQCLSSCLVDFCYSSTCFCRCWLSVGAQPIDTVRGILMRVGLILPRPMVLMGQKKGPASETSNPEKSITL